MGFPDGFDDVVSCSCEVGWADVGVFLRHSHPLVAFHGSAERADLSCWEIKQRVLVVVRGIRCFIASDLQEHGLWLELVDFVVLREILHRLPCPCLMSVEVIDINPHSGGFADDRPPFGDSLNVVGIEHDVSQCALSGNLCL